ncbi:glycosyltransferase [Candidatus Thioglobus sp.]|nr:glycosyltransferase [Candidatus Thioglobus sp.]
MKILYLSKSPIPSRQANSIHVMNMCSAFSKQHNILLLGTKVNDDSLIDIFSYYGVKGKFLIDLIKKRNNILNAISYFEVIKKLFKFNPDLVYGRSHILCWLAVILRFPVIFESHDPPFLFSGLRGFVFNQLLQSNKLIRIIVISSTLKKAYCDYGFNEHKILVSHDAANHNNSIPLKFENSDRLQVGYVGHLYKGRGIEIIASMAKQCKWADFHIVGGMKADIVSWKSLFSNIDNLTFHGFMNPSKVHSFMRGCNVLLAPYQSVVEIAGGGNTVDWMSPLKIFEYMSSGVPIIASDLASLREVLVPDETCLMCKCNDVKEWVDKLKSFQSNSLRRKISRAAYEVFNESYTWDIRAKAVLDGLKSNLIK